jgi:hypothetical protein
MVQPTSDPKAHKLPPGPLKHSVNIWALVVPSGLAAITATLVLSINAGPAAFVVPALAGGAMFLVLHRKAAWLGLSHDNTVLLFGVLTAASALFAVSGMQVNANNQARAEVAQQIVALGRTNPAAQRARLAMLDDEMLSTLGKLEPGLERLERARREDEVRRSQEKKLAAEQQKLAAKQQENAERAASLLKTADSYSPDEIDLRAAIYHQLVDLEPGNAEYSRMLAELKENQDRLQAMRDHPEKGLTLVDYQWSKGGFGSVMLLDATIRNVSEIAIKDLTILCQHSAPSGTVIDSNMRVAYERIEPGKTKRLRRFNMGLIAGQAAGSSCTIESAVVAE